MSKLQCLEIEPNEVERAIIEWDVATLKNQLIDQSLLISLGYSETEIIYIQQKFFGITIANPSQMTYFEKAVYSNEKRIIENYYHYLRKNKSVMESFGYTKKDLNNIYDLHIKGILQMLTSATDYYEISTRLSILQKNKNRMTETYIIRYLNEEESNLIHKKEMLNRLIMIYREEEHLPGRKDDINRMIEFYPEILEYSQLARSVDIELIYGDKSDETRYEKICKKGLQYEKKLKECDQKAQASELSAEEEKQIKDERTKFTLEDKAKYLYAIAASKCNKNKLKYFIDEKLDERTNVKDMMEFLNTSGELLKAILENPGAKNYGKILHTMAKKAEGEKAGANYGFLLYLNREFGDEYGINKIKLEESYKNADLKIGPFSINGYGTYLYALAQEYVREHNTLEGFEYKAEFLCLKREFYSYFNKQIEKQIMKDPVDCETIRTKINSINICISTGEKKFLKEEKLDRKERMPRFLCFFPEQDTELSIKYEDILLKNLESSRKSNTTRDMLNNLKLSVLPAPSQSRDVNVEDKLNEITYYVWKKIQYNFDRSKDQWLILAKIYEYNMNWYKRQADNEEIPEIKAKHKEDQLQWTKKVANALRIRAEISFVYDDWYDLYQFYLKQIETASPEETSTWMKAAYELYLEMAYRTRKDSDQVGKHFVGLSKYFKDKDNNYFKRCVTEDKSIASRYINELATLYYQYRQYRYLKLAFEITKVSGEYELYLRKFIRALVQWEMIQLIKNMLYLLSEGEYSTAQLFYSYSVEHVNHIPRILTLTHELIEGLVIAESAAYQSVLNQIKVFPNVQKSYYIERVRDESSMSDQIKALEFILQYYTATNELTGEVDCSSIQYALYLQYQQLYSRTMREEHLEKMFEAIEQSSREEENLSNKYKIITLCYRYSSLNRDAASIIENMKLSKELADKIKGYQQRLEELKSMYGDTNDEAFKELCDLTLRYSPKSSIKYIKSFLKKYIISNAIEMNKVLIEYLMSFELIGKVWLQLYFEESDGATKERSFVEYTYGFDSVCKVIQILENTNKSNGSKQNIDYLKECVSDFRNINTYIALVEDYLKNNPSYRPEEMELLHHFFAIMAKEEEISLYNVVDAINKRDQYKNTRCTDLLNQLYQTINDPQKFNYITALARQYAKAGNYKEAEEIYRKVLKAADSNPYLTKQYAYINIHRITMSLLNSANNNIKIKVSEVVDMRPNQVYEVLAYLSEKYPDEVTNVMEMMELEEDRNLLLYIHQLVTYAKLKKKSYPETSADSKEEIWEEKLFDTLLHLKGTRYFSYLLPNLYQVSNNAGFKYSLASHEDTKIQSVLKEANHKPILVLKGQDMKPGQKLMLIDYDSQAMNSYIEMPEEKQGIPLLQKVINDFDDKKAKPLSDLLLRQERENSNENRKTILLHVLTNQSNHPCDIEKDAESQRQLQLSKAELGYLLHLEAFEKNYEDSMEMLHEGVICLGSNKSDCLDLLEKIREQYFKLLEKLPELQLQNKLKRIPNIAYDLHKIVRIFDNKLNYKNVFLGEMIVILGQVQKFEKSINPSSGIEALEGAMNHLIALEGKMKEEENRLTGSITKGWRSWIYSELVQIVSQNTIIDNKYFIDRKESKLSLENFYQEVINAFHNINLYGPRGIGVSSLMKQCNQVYYEKALVGNNIFLYLDGKEFSMDNFTEEFSGKLYDQFVLGIRRINDLGFVWAKDIHDNMKSYDGSLNYLNGMRQNKVHLFIDHYEMLYRNHKNEMDKILYQLANQGFHLVIGSENAIQAEYVKFSTMELAGFTETGTRDYLVSRLKYKEHILQAIPVKEVYKLTWGIPALLRYVIEYALEVKAIDLLGAKNNLKNKAKSLFDHWEPLWGKDLYREDNVAYRSYIDDKNGLDQNIKDYLDSIVNCVVDAKFDDRFGKESFSRKKDLKSGDEINLYEYQQSLQWKEEAEVNMAEFNMSKDIWEAIKREEDVYQYIKYGEALRRFTHNIHQPNYDYSVFALNYCLAFELISNRVMKGFFMKKIPWKNVSFLSQCKEANITKLKESLDTTMYTVGSYNNFLTTYKDNYQEEVKNIGFDFEQYCKTYEEVKDIRNKVAHVGDIIDGKQFSKFLSLLFGDSNNPVGQPSVFEGILRLVNQ